VGQLLIVGCGNRDRGDDAAGLLVVERLRSMGIAAQGHSGEGLALMEIWSAAESVWLIDAVVTGAAPGVISVWDARTAPVSRDAFCTSTHSFGVGEAVELARTLGRLPASLRIYGIEARNFEQGSRPAPEVLAAVDELAHRIAKELDGCTNPAS
jgi:hydrogenase maturation protease